MSVEVFKLSERYGKHVLHHAASLPANVQAQHEGERGDVPKRRANLFKGEGKRRRLRLPAVDVKV